MSIFKRKLQSSGFVDGRGNKGDKVKRPHPVLSTAV
jgi:hypothetical protein